MRSSMFALTVATWFTIAMVSHSGLCVAQEIETPGAPDAPDARDGRGPVFAPSGWLGLNVPVHDRFGLRLYGFYIGNLKVPVAQLDVPIRVAKFLTVTPSYLYLNLPASGLNTVVSREPAVGFARSQDEHQFRIDETVSFSINKFEISQRNMYVRRFRPTDEIDRYRNRITIAHPITVNDQTWKPFTSYEAYYEWNNGGWNRNRFWVGVTLPLKKHVSFQPSYMRESSRGLRDVNYLLFGLIFSTR